MPLSNGYEILKNICEKRYSCRSFSDQSVNPQLIEKIKNLALTSPYVSGKKNWEIEILMDKEKIRQVAEAVRAKAKELREGMNEDFRSSFDNYAKMFTAFENTPVLFLPVFRISQGLSLLMTSPSAEIAQYERDNYVKSISCVAMLILLGAESLGLASCYMTGPLIAEKEITKIANIKNGRNIGAILPVGYPSRS